MKIGVSLPLGYLVDSLESEDEHLFSQAFGPSANCLDTLREHGVGSIEIGHIKALSNAEHVRLAAVRVLEAGMGLTMHGFRPDSEGACFSAAFPSLKFVPEELAKRGARSLLNLHCPRFPEGNLEDATAWNAALFSRLVAIVKKEGIPLRIAIEVTRDKGTVSPSHTYQGLLDLRGRIGDDIGFGWDLGHAYWSVWQKMLELAAPVEFTRGVIHTHIHAIDPGGQTHWPLTMGTLPLKEYVSQLRRTNYQGVYNLEMYPRRWATAMDVKEGILSSVATLQAVL